MKKFIKEGSFVDFAGKTHYFTVCGCLQNVNLGINICVKDETSKSIGKGFETIFSVGVSICNPEDEYNKELGIKQATGRAEKVRNCALVMTIDNRVMFTPSMAEEVTNSIVKDIVRVPGKYIEGYNRMEENYAKSNSNPSVNN